MELMSETPTELYFHKNSTKVQVVAVGLFICGLLIIFAFGWRTDIQCNCVSSLPYIEGSTRDCGGWCNTTMTNLWMVREQKIPTRNIRAALVEGSGTYRILLLLTAQDESEEILSDDDVGGEQIPLLHFYSYGRYESKRKLANRINDIVNGKWKLGGDEDIVLRDTQDDRWFAYFVGAVFMSVLVIVLVLTKKEVCVLDKDESLLALIRSTTFTRREEVYSLNEISLVELHRNTQDRKTEYKVFFEIEPSRSSTNSVSTSSTFFGGPVVRHIIIETGDRWIGMCEEGSYATEEEAQKVCQHIRTFLGIPSLDDIMREKKKT